MNTGGGITGPAPVFMRFKVRLEREAKVCYPVTQRENAAREAASKAAGRRYRASLES